MLDEVEMVKDDVEPLEQTDGGFGGAIDGGFKAEKSSSVTVGGIGWNGTFRSPRKSGGGRTNVPGGGGGAAKGGGGTSISPWSRSGTEMTDPLDKLSSPTGGKRGKMMKSFTLGEFKTEQNAAF